MGSFGREAKAHWRMYFKLTLLLLLWYGWSTLAILLLLINMIVNKFHSKIFSIFCANLGDEYNMLTNSFKLELFKDLNEMKPGEKISVLEIGAGPGANFKYYNRDMAIQIVEPNQCFEAVFNSNKAKYPKLDIGDMKVGYCEDLPIEDSSIDAVVITLVLCSVQDQAKCFREINRVLKPGGKFFYMEHIVDDTDVNIRIAQQCFTSCGFWQFAFDGCCIDRSTAEAVEVAGFSKVEQTKYDLPLSDLMSPMFKLVRIFIKRHVMG